MQIEIKATTIFRYEIEESTNDELAKLVDHLQDTDADQIQDVMSEQPYIKVLLFERQEPGFLGIEILPEE